ncbi:STAS domain-containing protein [Streptomyces roseus]|uniref:STAS domain-containing protein n=1 Tax=Streptomyces roseus TaxID=66430 RepID=UPI00069D91A4|nr:STAS domain-containing protein [Streptomyces roseus]
MTYSDRERDPAVPMVSVAVRPGPQRTRAEVSGEIDADNCGEVREALSAALDASTTGLDVGLSALTFCDSSALHLLLDLHHAATTSGKTLVLHEPRPQFTRLLDFTGTAPVFTIHTPAAHPPDPHDGRHNVTGGDATRPAHHRPHALDPAIAYDDEP